MSTKGFTIAALLYDLLEEHVMVERVILSDDNEKILFMVNASDDDVDEAVALLRRAAAPITRADLSDPHAQAWVGDRALWFAGFPVTVRNNA